MIRLLTFLLLSITLAACASIPQASTTVTQWPTPIAEFEIQPSTESMEFPIPILEVADAELDWPLPVLPLHERAVVRFTNAEVRCMAEVIYREARGEPEIGQIGVGYVVLNRMASPNYPSTICGVVYDRKHGCQFSWACGKARGPMRSAEYQRSEEIALLVMSRIVENPVDDATFFRHKSSRHLSKNRELRTVIGNHRFIAAI